MVQFSDYHVVLARMLNACIKEPHIHLAVFVMQPNGDARLDFIQVGQRAGRPDVGGGGLGLCGDSPGPTTRETTAFYCNNNNNNKRPRTPKSLYCIIIQLLLLSVLLP